MIIRGLDANKDWMFGRGKNDYKKNLDALKQDIETRLMCFLGDCFYDASNGIDWFFLLGSKNRLQLELAIATTIINTQNVTSLNQFSVNQSQATRTISISYKVDTLLGVINSIFQYDVSNLIG